MPIAGDRDSSSIQFHTIFANNRATGPAPNLDIVKSFPLILHAAGEDAEILNQAVNLVVCPFTNRSHRQPVEHRNDLRAEPIMVNLITLLPAKPLALSINALAQIKVLIHDESLKSTAVPEKLCLLEPTITTSASHHWC